MATVSVYFIVFAVVICFEFIHLFECSSLNQGFSIDLIHRDSHKSPLHDPSIRSHFIKLNQAFNRSLLRASFLQKKKHASSSLILSTSSTYGGDGEYIMSIFIGTPPVLMTGHIDTGSDLTWTQCSPCLHCNKQSLPFFNPKNTSTYKPLSCHSNLCDSIICKHHGSCQYNFTYPDGTYTSGNLATETFSFGEGAVMIPDVTFGCTHDSAGFYNETASGIVGLGGGPLSLIHQISKYNSIDKKFSYCLVPLVSNLTSKIYFGRNDAMVSKKVVSTPMFKDYTFYYINLQGISVGNTRIRNSHRDHNSNKGNMIVDSGTTFTNLPTKLYNDLVSTLIISISANRNTSDPYYTFGLCYNKKDGDHDPVFPDIVFHFQDADVRFPNSFVEADDGVFCLAMIPNDDISIFGNLSMINFLVEIDLENKKVNFMPTECGK